MVQEHRSQYADEGEAVRSIASKIGCEAKTLRQWISAESGTKQADGKVDQTEQDRIKALEREVRELRQANEILRKASAYFAQAELDRPFKR